MEYEVVDVSDWPVMSQEPGGAEPKDWLAHSSDVGGSGREHLWLYKKVKRGVRSDYRRYDDVAERVASALAKDIGLPAAIVELARRGDDEGIISRNVAPDDWEMHSGDAILFGSPGYVPCFGEDRRKNRVGHNLANIMAVLADCQGPPGGPCAEWSAFEVFAGFLVFDAWIANTDRHAINWAVLERDGERRLAPSFDHGSALASGYREADLARMDPTTFARRGRAGRFEGGESITLVDLAREAVARGGPHAREWLERVGCVERSRLDEILCGMVVLSEERRMFLGEILRENQRRLGA